jgi:hypothetical protein
MTSAVPSRQSLKLPGTHPPTTCWSSMDNFSSEDLLLLGAAGAAHATMGLVIDYASSLYDKTPYHTSALSGAAWVSELLNGHPECIRCELGIHKHVFHHLIVRLLAAGIVPSQDVSIEEKLAIFLYMSVTGLTIHHVREQFQHANGTISR